MRIHHRALDRRAKAHELRDQKLATGFTWRGARFQADNQSRAAISARAMRVQRTGETVVEWRTVENEAYPFSGEEFLAFADAVDAYAEEVMKRTWELKAGASR